MEGGEPRRGWGRWGRWRIWGGVVGVMSAERGERRGGWVLVLLVLFRTSMRGVGREVGVLGV